MDPATASSWSLSWPVESYKLVLYRKWLVFDRWNHTVYTQYGMLPIERIINIIRIIGKKDEETTNKQTNKQDTNIPASVMESRSKLKASSIHSFTTRRNAFPIQDVLVSVQVIRTFEKRCFFRVEESTRYCWAGDDHNPMSKETFSFI